MGIECVGRLRLLFTRYHFDFATALVYITFFFVGGVAILSIIYRISYLVFFSLLYFIYAERIHTFYIKSNGMEP